MLDLAIVLLFVAVTIGSGFRARKAASRNLDEYFLAGRTVSGWRAGLSMAATQFAADTPLIVMGLIATGGIFLFWQFWVYGIAFLMMGFLFGASWRRAGVLTDAELAEVRYSGRGRLALRVLKAFYYGTLINCIVMAFVLAATVQIAEVFLVWHQWLPAGLYDPLRDMIAALDVQLTRTVPPPNSGSGPGSGLDPLTATTNNMVSIGLLLAFIAVYSTTGGLRSVIFTDVFQLGIALFGTLIYAVIVVVECGGLGAMVNRLVDIYGDDAARRTLSFAPDTLDMIAPFLVLMGLQWLYQVNSDGTGYLAQRTMACRTDREARIAAVVFTWTQIFLRSVLWIVIGIALLVLYPLTTDMTDGTLSASREATFITGIKDYLPAGISGLMLTGLLAALASTIDTHLNLGAAYWSNDLYKRLVNEAWLKREPGERELVWVARASTLVVLGLALLVMGHLSSIAQGWKISLLFGAGVGSVLILRWLWERINVTAELSAIAVSLVAGVVLLMLLPDDDQEWLRLGLMALLSTATVVTAALLAPPTDQDTLKSFYKKARPVGFWGSTARALGEDPSVPLRRFTGGLTHTVTCALAVFLAIYGTTRLLLPLPDTPSWPAWTALITSLALTPIWLGGIIGPDTDQESVTPMK